MEWHEYMNRPHHYYKRWKYKNLTLIAASIALVWYLADHPAVLNFLDNLANLGYIGAFVAGAFFVSVFTIAPAAVVLYHLAGILDPYQMALFAGAGGVLGDYVIFRFLRGGVLDELKPLFEKMGGSYVKKLLHTPYFFWLTPLIGAILIASPMPDEIGVGIMGISKIKTWQFVLLSFVLDTLGIFAIVMLARGL